MEAPTSRFIRLRTRTLAVADRVTHRGIPLGSNRYFRPRRRDSGPVPALPSPDTRGWFGGPVPRSWPRGRAVTGGERQAVAAAGTSRARHGSVAGAAVRAGCRARAGHDGLAGGGQA